MRETGITSIGCIVPLPADSTVSTRSPSSEPVRMCAVVSDPSGTLPFIGERHQSIAVLQRHIRHRADLHPRHHHGVARGEAAGFGKQRLVSDRSSPSDISRSGDRPTRMTSATRTTPMNPALNEAGSAILKHQGSAHLPALT